MLLSLTWTAAGPDLRKRCCGKSARFLGPDRYLRSSGPFPSKGESGWTSAVRFVLRQSPEARPGTTPCLYRDYVIGLV